MINYGKQSINQEDINAVVETLKSDFLTTGPKVSEFEEELAKKLNFKYVVAVSNGTAALHLASICLLNRGDKVITTPISFIATSNSILYQKARVIFVDTQKNGLIDLNLLEEKLKKEKIKALYLVSLTGLMFDEEKVKYLKNKYNIKILYDNAHYFGRDRGICDIATYSFHPVKHITTFEGGAIATNDKKIYEKLLRLRNHGIVKDSSMYPWEYKMVDLGYNYRLSDVACSLGISQLKRVDEFIKKRRDIAKYYHQNLPFYIKPLYEYNETSSYHLFIVKHDFKNLDEKAKFFLKMKQKGINLQLHYIPIYKHPYYKKLGIKCNCQNAEEYYIKSFSLPIYPDLSFEEVDFVIKSLKEILK